MSFQHPITRVECPDYMSGVICPMFTPVDRERRIDDTALGRYAHWLVDQEAITTLFWRSGVGRMFSYSEEEFYHSLDVVMESVGGKKPVFAGTSGIHDGDFSHKADAGRYLDETLRMCDYASEKGAAAVVLVIPAALPIKEGISAEDIVVGYFERVHANTKLPIIMYNPQIIPEEYSVTPDMVKYLATLDRMIGLKLSTNDLYWQGRIIDAVEGKNFSLISGSECVYFQALMTGATGVIGQGCNIYPMILRRILDAVFFQDWESARRAQMDVNRALDGFQSLPPDQSGFAYLRKAGLEVSPYCRDGSDPLSEDVCVAISQAIEPILSRYMEENF